MPASYDLTTPFIFKTISTVGNDNWPDFVAGLLGIKKGLRTNRNNFTIRLGRPNAEGVRKYEVVPSRGKPPLFSAAEKQGFTKHQSTSYCHPSYYQPKYFGQAVDVAVDVLVGMRFALKDTLLQRIMLYDEATFTRPYDHFSEEEARAYLTRKCAAKDYHENLDSLAATGRLSTFFQRYNEVMARLRAALDESMQVVVFTDNLEARLLAQTRRLDLEKALKRPDAAARIPISFYQPLRYYTDVEQQDDLTNARAANTSPRIKALGLFLEKSQTGFTGLSMGEWNIIWPIINNLSHATRGEALIQYLSQITEAQALKCLDKASNTLYFLQLLVHSSRPCPNEIKRLFFSATRGHIIRCLSKENANNHYFLFRHYFSFIASCLTLDEKIALLSETDTYGNNVMMLAVRTQPDALPAILDIFESLPMDEKRKIILQTGRSGATILTTLPPDDSSYTYLEVVVDKLATVLSKDELGSSLMKPCDKGRHFLMYHAYYRDITHLLPILERIERKLGKNYVSSILKQTDNEDNQNSLMVALKHRPVEVSKAILAAIEGLDDDDKRAIFKQTNNRGETILMLAARHQPGLVSIILHTIDRLFDESSKIALLKQTNTDGWNALMIATQNKPDSVPPILRAIKDLSNDEDKRAILLKQVDKAGRHAFVLGSGIHTIAHFLKVFYLLNDTERSQFFNQKAYNRKKLSRDYPYLDVHFKKEELSFQLGVLIRTLEQQLRQYENTDGTYHAQLRTVSEAIKENFYHYQQRTEQDKEATIVLAQSCKAAMSTVNHRRVFPGDIQSILMGIARIVGILLLVGIPHAIKRYHQSNKSVFFTTPIERLTDKIEMNITTLLATKE